MLRPKEVLVRGLTLEGDEIEVEADELLARLFQHEIDHLQGVLMFDRMLPDQRKIALNEYQKHEKSAKSSEPVHVRLT
jgi:peptide deformylase